MFWGCELVQALSSLAAPLFEASSGKAFEWNSEKKEKRSIAELHL
jgi:hypothetical protein